MPVKWSATARLHAREISDALMIHTLSVHHMARHLPTKRQILASQQGVSVASSVRDHGMLRKFLVRPH